MMCGHLVFIDLPEDGCLVVDCLGLPSQQTGGQAGYVAGKGQFRSW
jgi:hypothetical protein